MNRVFKKSCLGYLFAFLFLSSFFSQAMAATLTVPSAVYPTIQSAVDAAMAGDTVKVKWGGGLGDNGEYLENVIIETPINMICPPKKGKGAAVIDVSNTVTNLPGADYSAGIYIEAGGAGTTIKGCTVQFAQFCDLLTTPACPSNGAPGHGIVVDAPGVTLNKVLTHGCQASGVRIYGSGDDFLVKGSASRANGADGFRIGEDLDFADNGIITKSMARGNGNDGGSAGFSIQGNNLEITGNKSEQNDLEGFYVQGNSNLIQGNVTFSNNTYGFQILGNNHTIRGNGAINSGDDCFRVGDLASDGNDNDFLHNAAGACGNDGFNVDCNSLGGTCGDIIGNQVIYAVNEGFDLNFHRDNTIADNRAEGAENQGFRLSNLENVTVRNNIAVNNGRAGFRSSDGFDNTFFRNISRNNGGDGLRLVNTGDGTLIDSNKIEKNWQDGIDINRDVSIGNIIRNNAVMKNRGTGIENDAQDTIITNNKVKKNRTDIAGLGARVPPAGPTGTVNIPLSTGNNFNTGGFNVSTPGTGWNDGNLQ